MYYITPEESLSISTVTKTLKQFEKLRRPKDGTRWIVRKHRRIGFGGLPVYEAQDGKLRKTKDWVIPFPH